MIVIEIEDTKRIRYFSIIDNKEDGEGSVSIYDKCISGDYHKITKHITTIDHKEVLIIRIFAGSGHYMDYIILGEIDGHIRILLESEGIFQGSLDVSGNHFIERYGSRDKKLPPFLGASPPCGCLRKGAIFHTPTPSPCILRLREVATSGATMCGASHERRIYGHLQMRGLWGAQARGRAVPSPVRLYGLFPAVLRYRSPEKGANLT
jgi:hypothetical protein